MGWRRHGVADTGMFEEQVAWRRLRTFRRTSRCGQSRVRLSLRVYSVRRALTQMTRLKLLKNSALIPLYASLVSILVILTHLVTRTSLFRRLSSRLQGREYVPKERAPRQATPPPSTFREEVEEHVQLRGGWTIFLCNALRFAGCLALLGLSIHAAIVTPGPDTRAPPIEVLKKKHGKKHRKGAWFSHDEWVEIALCGFYVRPYLRLDCMRFWTDD